MFVVIVLFIDSLFKIKILAMIIIFFFNSVFDKLRRFYYLFFKRNWFILVFCSLIVFVINSCTQEQQNKFSRSIQNFTGTNGVLDVMSEGKVMYRIINIDKLSTAISTSAGSIPRPYRFGYGVYDLNFNYKQDAGEKKMYFEFSDYSTPYFFYENPTQQSSQQK